MRINVEKLKYQIRFAEVNSYLSNTKDEGVKLIG